MNHRCPQCSAYSETRAEADRHTREMHQHCDSMFTPMVGTDVEKCVRRSDHPGSHCSVSGRQWKA